MSLSLPEGVIMSDTEKEKNEPFIMTQTNGSNAHRK